MMKRNTSNTVKIPRMVAQRNKVTESRHDWSLLMSRAYICVIAQFAERYHSFRKNGERSPDGELFPKVRDYSLFQSYTLPRSAMTTIGAGGKPEPIRVRLFKKTFDKLTTFPLIEGSLDDEEDWVRINVIAAARYDKATDSIYYELSAMMVDQLAGLTEQFTSLSIKTAMAFKDSKYSFWFYSYCCQWKGRGTFTLTLEELRHRFCLDGHTDVGGRVRKAKYPTVDAFKAYVLEPARKELEALFEQGISEVKFSYENICRSHGQGRPSVVGFAFRVFTRNNAGKNGGKLPLAGNGDGGRQLSLFEDEHPGFAREKLEEMTRTYNRLTSNDVSVEQYAEMRGFKLMGDGGGEDSGAYE